MGAGDWKEQLRAEQRKQEMQATLRGYFCRVGKGKYLPLGEAIREAAEQFSKERWSIPSDEEIAAEMEGYDFSNLDRRVKESIEKMMEEHRKASIPKVTHFSLRKMKRIAVAVAVLISMVTSLVAAPAQVKTLAFDFVIDWTEERMGLRYTTQEALLTALPEGYGPHYIPEGLKFVESLSPKDKQKAVYHYQRNNENFEIDIRISILENTNETFIDNEFAAYQKVEINGATGYLGTFDTYDGCTLEWVDKGIAHSIYVVGEIDESELYKIAENIY